MKNILFSLVLLVLVSSCKNTKETEVSTTQQLAQTAGLNNWNDVEEIKFTFNVDKNGTTVMSRKWKWNPNTDAVQLIAREDTVNYNRKAALDSIQISTDRGFINDVYWLLPEYKLIWDQGTSITEEKSQIAPISKETLDKVTILYTGDGGYTPGDAYDIYYDNKHKIKEWAYRRQNDTAIGMATTFEDFKTVKGLTFATTHKTADGSTNINFTDIEITKKK
jgi:hypothetical protein